MSFSVTSFITISTNIINKRSAISSFKCFLSFPLEATITSIASSPIFCKIRSSPSLYNLANDYPKFYGDLKNSQSLKYQELFAITMQRALEYYKNINFNRFSIKSVVFLTMFEQAENEDFSKDYRKSILTKLISYCEGMSKEDIGGRADWEESLKEYREQMTKLEKV